MKKNKLGEFINKIKTTLHLMVGVPSYQQYVLHRAKFHPGEEILSEAEFFKKAQSERYGSGANRCC